MWNIEATDAFISATSPRRPSFTLTNERKVEEKPSQLATIRARIFQKKKKRKPFLTRRKLDVEELRNILWTQIAHEGPPNCPPTISQRPSPFYTTKSAVSIHSEEVPVLNWEPGQNFQSKLQSQFISRKPSIIFRFSAY